MTTLPELVGVEEIDPFISKYHAKPWALAATAMFDEWRIKSPNVCVLCWLRFMDASALAIKTLQSRKWPKSYVMHIPYLSNDYPVKHYTRRVTLADFGVTSEG